MTFLQQTLLMGGDNPTDRKFSAPDVLFNATNITFSHLAKPMPLLTAPRNAQAMVSDPMHRSELPTTCSYFPPLPARLRPQIRYRL
ncbi:hypothetical protein BDZ97DRAFT_1881293 [Flammula alnicola]|nr:hypothetical protein BDZ97DRAFT_1881293 [Flammula alnicola]